MSRCRGLVGTLQRTITRARTDHAMDLFLCQASCRPLHCHQSPLSLQCYQSPLSPFIRTMLPNSRCFSTSDSSANSKMTLSKRLKRYGVAFAVVDCCTWAASFGVFFLLFSAGVQLETVLLYAEHVTDVWYWADVFNINIADLSGDNAALSLSLISCTITSPIRLNLDLLLLFLLTEWGFIRGFKNKS